MVLYRSTEVSCPIPSRDRAVGSDMTRRLASALIDLKHVLVELHLERRDYARARPPGLGFARCSRGDFTFSDPSLCFGEVVEGIGSQVQCLSRAHGVKYALPVSRVGGYSF